MRFVNGPRSPKHAARAAPHTMRERRGCIVLRTREIPRLAVKRAPILGGMTHVTITPRPNGPLIIDGPVRIVTPDGQGLTPPPRKDGKPAEVDVLCSCGGSAIKMFCDGTHKRNGFQYSHVIIAMHDI